MKGAIATDEYLVLKSLCFHIQIYKFIKNLIETIIMLDILDFIAEKGGDLAKLSESQLRRYASTELINEVIKRYHQHREGERQFLLHARPRFNLEKRNTQRPRQDKA